MKYKVLPKKHFGHRSSVEKRSYPKKRGKPERKLVAFYGSGRCGTTFSANAMRKVGLDIRHQYMGKDGTSSHWFFVPSIWWPRELHTQHRAHVGERRENYTFDHQIQLVRHPLKCIPSMCAVFGTMVWEFAIDNGLILEDEIHKASKMKLSALWWLRVNRTLEDVCSVRIKMEDYKLHWPGLMKLLGAEGPYPNKANKNKASKWSQYKALTWKQLQAYTEDEVLVKNIHKMAGRYGYE